jgi:hypothetical protein
MDIGETLFHRLYHGAVDVEIERFRNGQGLWRTKRSFHLERFSLEARSVRYGDTERRPVVLACALEIQKMCAQSTHILHELLMLHVAECERIVAETAFHSAAWKPAHNLNVRNAIGFPESLCSVSEVFVFGYLTVRGWR